MDHDDIQGLVFSGYGRLVASACVGVRFGAGQPHPWLRRLLSKVSSAAGHERTEAARLNIAFTYGGLEKLELDPGALAAFPREFREGMAHPACSARLGDFGEDAAAGWSFGAGSAGAFDAVVLLYGETAEVLDAKLGDLQRESARWGVELECHLTYLPADRREHFGFEMAATTLRFRGDGRGRSAERRLATGEFLLGHRDGAGERSVGPLAPLRAGSRPRPLKRPGRRVDLGFNGSYLVLRKLEQRVDAFRDLVARAGEPPTGARLAAKLVGRWPNGASLALFPDAEPSAEKRLARLDYGEDPHGFGCPLGAHVRRANPRGDDSAAHDAPRHQLLRRGRLFAESNRRGLLFMALNADIARQFEVVQGRWLNGEHFAGLRGERDPLLGADSLSLGGDAEARRFTVQARPFRARFELPRLTRLLGGAYCFLPSIRALGYLADAKRFP